MCFHLVDPATSDMGLYPESVLAMRTWDQEPPREGAAVEEGAREDEESHSEVHSEEGTDVNSGSRASRPP